MHIEKEFNVFGDPVRILASSATTNNSFVILTQTCQPGGGPPPHLHDNEDEAFLVKEGEFELFDGSAWHRLTAGEMAIGMRNQVHTFRNCGNTVGTLMVFIPSSRIDLYLEEISVIQMPQDFAKLIEISDRYGIHFPGA